jgi:hypothetical protein
MCQPFLPVALTTDCSCSPLFPLLLRLPPTFFPQYLMSTPYPLASQRWRFSLPLSHFSSLSSTIYRVLPSLLLLTYKLKCADQAITLSDLYIDIPASSSGCNTDLHLRKYTLRYQETQPVHYTRLVAALLLRVIHNLPHRLTPFRKTRTVTFIVSHKPPSFTPPLTYSAKIPTQRSLHQKS